MGTGKENNQTEIYRKDFIYRCLQTIATTIFWPFQEFLCNSNKDSSAVCKTSAALGQKHPTSNRFSNWGSIFEIYIKLLFNSVGCYWQWTNSCTSHGCHTRSSWKYSFYKYWWNNCTEQRHCCFQWWKQCWHGICYHKRYCNKKKCRWWQLRWGIRAKCQKDVCC